MQKLKAVADRYKVQKTLFKVNNYLYAQIFDKHTLDTVIGCVYVYENQQPGQILKMLLQKFSTSSRMSNLIFPTFHVKDNLHDKSISIFFMGQHIMPLQLFGQQQYESLDINQMLKFTYDTFCSLHFLHSHDIVHGNISLSTCYLSKSDKEIDFALCIIDTSVFREDLVKSNESMIFRSESQQNGLSNFFNHNQETSYKDDAQSIIYVLLHLISKGKMMSKTRYYKDWMHPSQLLRWKSMDFFKQMVQLLPPELEFLTQIFTIVKSLSRNQKPDYPKFIKKTYSKLKQKQNADIKGGNKKMVSGSFSMQKMSTQQIFSTNNFTDQIKNQTKAQKQKPVPQKLQVEKQNEDDKLLIMDSDNEDNGLQSKFSKLQSTKCTVKMKSFWNQKVLSEE